MGIFIIILVVAILLAVLLIMDANAPVIFTLMDQKYDCPAWMLLFGAVIATALLSWIIHVLGQRQLKVRLRERQQELDEAKERLRTAENNLAEHQSKIHEFTLQVLQLARSPMPQHAALPPQVNFEEVIERSALGPAPSSPSGNAGVSDDIDTQTIPRVPEL